MIKTTSFGPVKRFDLSRTLFGKGRYWTIAYWIDGLMIDTGCAYTAQELANAMAGLPVSCITNTHSHEDHIGANRTLQSSHTGLTARAHPCALPVLVDPQHAQPLQPYRRLFWGMPQASMATAVLDGEVIETENYRFQVLFTPGHSPDHLCVYEARQGWLFSGDLFVGGQDQLLRVGQDIWLTIKSLKRIAALPAVTLFPGCARVRQDPQDELQRRITYMEGFGERVLRLHQQGCSPSEIVHRLCGPPKWVEVVTLGHFSRRQLVNAYLRAPDDD